MNNIYNHLQKEEEILYSGNANPSKTTKQIFRLILGYILMVLFLFITIKYIENKSILEYFIILLEIIMIIFLTFGLFNKVILNFRHKNNKYYITNKRIIKLYSKNKIKFGNIFELKAVAVIKQKNNYADLDIIFDGKNLYDISKKAICFEGVENPKEIIKIILQINDKIIIEDDSPIFMGKKIKPFKL